MGGQIAARMKTVRASIEAAIALQRSHDSSPSAAASRRWAREIRQTPASEWLPFWGRLFEAQAQQVNAAAANMARPRALFARFGFTTQFFSGCKKFRKYHLVSDLGQFGRFFG